METFSSLVIICEGNPPVTGEFPLQRQVTRSFDIFFDLRLNKLLSKQWRRRWMWRHRAYYDVTIMNQKMNTVLWPIMLFVKIPCHKLHIVKFGIYQNLENQNN